MELHLSPDLEQQLNAAADKAGCPADELAQDAIAVYLGDLSAASAMLDTRYDELKSGRVKLVPGDEVESYFREKSAAARRTQPGS